MMTPAEREFLHITAAMEGAQDTMWAALGEGSC